jgi:hypothetical protein
MVAMVTKPISFQYVLSITVLHVLLMGPVEHVILDMKMPLVPHVVLAIMRQQMHQLRVYVSLHRNSNVLFSSNFKLLHHNAAIHSLRSLLVMDDITISIISSLS